MQKLVDRMWIGEISHDSDSIYFHGSMAAEVVCCDRVELYYKDHNKYDKHSSVVHRPNRATLGECIGIMCSCTSDIVFYKHFITGHHEPLLIAQENK